MTYVFAFCLSVITLFNSSPLAAAQPDKEGYRYYLTATAIFRDEANYLKEWIEYHTLLGVEHFYLYNNLSIDDYQTILQPYIDSGLVELQDWPYENDENNSWAKIQKECYRNAIDQCKDETKWLFIFDTDEFFVPADHDTISSLIASEEVKKKNKKVARYQFGWVLFGTSGVAKVPSDRLMIEMLTLNQGKENIMYKSIVRPKYVGDKINPHAVSLSDNMKFKKIPLSTAQINHYILRDLDFLLNVKLPRVARYEKSTDYLFRVDEECCHKNGYSDKILRFVPELKARMGINTETKQES